MVEQIVAPDTNEGFSYEKAPFNNRRTVNTCNGYNLS